MNGQRKLKSLQRQLKRKRKGSRRYQQIQRQVALHHEYLTNVRKDFMFKLAYQWCDKSGMVFAESLNLKALAKGMLDKHCLDAAWGSLSLSGCASNAVCISRKWMLMARVKSVPTVRQSRARKT